MKPIITRAPFGHTRDGAAVSLFTLRNDAGMVVQVCDFGAIITSILAAGRDGSFADVVLGFDSIEPYLDVHPYFGALVGRYANRIAGARFALDGVDHQLDINEPPHHLHGGTRGFDRFLWDATVEGDTLLLERTSGAGEQGYPGTLVAQVRYRLDNDNSLSMVCRARSDAATPVNLTQHSYFNLAGGGDIGGHELRIAASAFTPIDAASIPLGTLAPVAGTAFDFRAARPIGSRIDDDDPQLRHGLGYDHNFVLDTGEPAARLRDPGSGRVLEVWTDQPGLQFYSGNFLDGSLQGKGRRFHYRSGLCLEPQHFPNSPNMPHFPPVTLRPGQLYHHGSRYRFLVEP